MFNLVKYAKRHGSKIVASFVLFISILLVAGRQALAYIDPGTGSYMLQIAIAFLVGAVFVIKRFWKKAYIILASVLGIKRKNGINRSEEDPH